MQLTQHFSLAEMTVSETAARYGINNTPSADIRGELSRTCSLLEIVRAKLGFPILITSGYRCPELNARIGGVLGSQHTLGQAADFISPGYGTPREIAIAIEADGGIMFDQLIYEYDSWVHISQPGLGKVSRGQVLTINNSGTTVGIV